MTDYIISPSILSADLARLGAESKAVLAAGADYIHVDVMDNHYVPNLTFGPVIVAALRQYGITAPLDIHLMIKPVDPLIPAFAQAGASYLSFHPEASEHIDRTIKLIHDHGCKAGLVFNPATPLNYLEYVIDQLDLILLMSVNPGFSGQKFIPETLEKLCKVRVIIDNCGRDIRLEVDGGIDLETIQMVAKAGADTFVSGSHIFTSSDYKACIDELRQALDRH